MFAIFPEILNQTAAGDLEAVTCLVRKYFADGQVFAPNLRVAQICANAEIKVRTANMKSAARMEAWDANGQFQIEISLHPEIRNHRELNYILASMLGHVFLDLQPKMAKGELQRSIFEKSQSPLREVLLNRTTATNIDQFACSLFLFGAMVKTAMTALASRQDVAAFFNVDLPLLDYRLDQLGLIQGASSEGQKEKPKSKTPPANEQNLASSREAKAKKPLAADTTLPKKEEKPKPKASSEDLSSMARVNRTTAARSYRMEGEQKTEVRKSSPKSPDSPASPGLERLRQLARKIDKSVSD